MFARALFIAGALAATAVADLEIIVPGGDELWWVANSANNIIWNCKDSQVQNFTVQITNSDSNILNSPLSIIAIQQNFDCSKTLTTQQGKFTPATGYQVQFSNPINSSEVYAQSKPFEIKAEGSPYPDASATPTAGASSSAASSTASGSNAESSDSSSAISQMTFSAGTFGTLLLGAFGALAF